MDPRLASTFLKFLFQYPRLAYIIGVPCGIAGVLLCLDDHVGNQHHQEHYRTDHHPARLPVDVGLLPSHEMDVFTETVRGHSGRGKCLTH